MKRQALVVGINRYPNLKDSKGNSQHLTYPATDGAEIDRLLREYGHFEVKRLPEICTDDAIQVDENGTVIKETLQREISKLFNPDNGDIPTTALLFFAGHSLQEPLPRNKVKGYLATSDADNKRIYGVPFDWLLEELIDSPVQNQIIWLDCCHSGEFTNLTFAQADAENRGQRNVNRLFIAACRESETAHGINGHGLLTSLLLKGLDPGQNTKGEWITSKSLDAFIHAELRKSSLSTFQQRFRSNSYGEPIQFWQKLGVSTSIPIVTENNASEKAIRHRGLFIPNARCRIVWGRDELVEEVLHRLTDPQELFILSLSGGPGYGKTEAASQIAQEALQRNLFADVLWVMARESEFVDGRISNEKHSERLNWDRFLHEIARQLECPVAQVHQRLRAEKQLVVLDNAETAEVEDILVNLNKMLNPSRALLTSRIQTNPPFVGLLPIQGLQERWSYQLLHSEAEYRNIPVLLQASEEQLHRVHQLSCGAPLALHFVVGLVSDEQAMEPVFSALEQASREVEVFYRFTLDTAWQRITDISKNILRYMGQADAGVTQAELFGAWELLPSDWTAARKELKRWYLIAETQDAKGNQRYDLHPWVRSSIRNNLVEKWEISLQDLEQIAKWKYGI